MSHTNRVVVLIDMDCFYCQVEEKLDPALEGKPIAVVQYNAWRGGGIIAVNYPAREKGVTRHMRGDEAKKKCSDLILAKVPNVRGKADLTKYREAGKRVADVLQTFTRLLERASVDEAYLDITEQVEKRIQNGISEIAIHNMLNTFIVGYETTDFIEQLHQNTDLLESDLKLAMGAVITEEIRAEVLKQTGYKCSAGVAHNKILAKLVCGLHKPNKQTVLPHSSVPELYKDLHIHKINSLGGKLGNSITTELQISFMGELLQFSEKELLKKFDDKTGKWLYNLARGIDLEPVTTRLISKSIGCCKRFPGRNALKTSEDVEHWLNELCEEISERLQKDLEENNRKAKQMVVSFTQKTDKDFVNSSRNHPLSSYEKAKISQGAMDVIRRFCMKADRTYHLTFLGVSVGNFQPLKNSKDIALFFKGMEKDTSKLKEEYSGDKREEPALFNNISNEQSECISNNNERSILEGNSYIKKTKTGNSFFEKFLKENPEFSNTSKSADVYKNEVDKKLKHETITESNKTKKTNSFFERFLKENPEFSSASKNIGNKVKQLDENPIEDINPGSQLEEDNCSVYSASTEELNEDTKNLIYLDDVYSESDCTRPIFRNAKEQEPSTSNNGCDGKENRFVKSFFLNYLKTEGILDTKSRISDESDKNESSESVQEAVDILEEMHVHVEQERQGCSTDFDNQTCPECNRTISNSEFVSHMDYHVALQMVKDEAHLYRNTDQSSRKRQDGKNDKKPGTKRKKVQESNSNSIVAFLHKPDGDITDDNSELCVECNKRIKFEDIASHLDYHTAKKLHSELNSNLHNTKKIATPVSNPKNRKSKQANVRTISTFFKSDI